MTAFDHALLQGELERLGLPALSEEKMAQLENYAEFLVSFNSHTNLTAITDPEGIALLHFADSLSLFLSGHPAGGEKICDVGSGAGFPMIPVLIARPDLSVTMMDSTEKKVRFLNEALSRVGLSEAGRAVSCRAEVAGKDPSFREQFDLVTARAVSRLNKLAELCLPLVRLGGYFVAMKGKDGEEEAKEAAKGISLLGGEICEIKSFFLANGEKRTLVIIKKHRPTPAKYPRAYKQIAATPLS